MTDSIRHGDVLAGRYRLVDLLSESDGGRFWRAQDRVLERHVALHVIDADDDRSEGLLEAARRSATVLDRRILRVLDAATSGGICYVVNEWGAGVSLDILVADSGPLGPRRSAWLVAEVAEAIAEAHEAGVAHGRLNPENVLIDEAGEVRIIGFCVDAALHGLPSDRVATDVSDLGGLLYCALTARWAGTSGSAVEAAPTEHGQVLRPRRVRAGIPRPLDLLCDEVLHPHVNGRGRAPQADLTTASGITTYLAEFVGDPAGMPDALLASLPQIPRSGPVVLPSVPEMAVRDSAVDLPAVEVEPTHAADRTRDDDEPAAAAGETPETTTAETQVVATPVDTPAEATTVDAAPGDAPPIDDAPIEDLPTEAGVPIFGQDEDDVSWFQARSTTPPPPPPFEAPPDRPLFAPEPAGGASTRTPRPSGGTTTANDGADYWPWDSQHGHRTGPVDDPVFDQSATTGHGLRAIEDEAVPGRNWLRLAGVISAVLLLLVATVVAYNLGRGRTPLGSEPEPEDSTPPAASEEPAAEAEPLTDLSATAFDPQDGGGNITDESAEEAPLAVDGDPVSAWTTQSYLQQFGPSGLKTGVGITIDLGGPRTVSSVALQFLGTPHSVELYLVDEAPTSVDGLDPVADGTADVEQLEVELDEAAEGQFLVVWLTSLPQEGSDFRGQIAEVSVLGGEV